jgi:hypothetical protein
MEQQQQQLEVPVYASRRERCMGIIAANPQYVQWRIEEGLNGLGPMWRPVIALGLHVARIKRKDLWRVPLHILSDMSDEAFDKSYQEFMLFLRDL